jgi:mono/diheme cytochrome c family protein
VTFVSDKLTDVTTFSNVTLYVPASQSPTPFLPAGKFTASFSAFVAVDLRGDFAFQADVNGSLKLEANGQTILETTTNGTTEASKPIRLGKGATNVLAVTFNSPAEGDAFLRLRWKPSESFFQPIPSAALSHNETPEQTTADKIRLGRELFIEHRCVKCHAGPKPENAIPELAIDAPSFEEIGARRNYEWMSRWILDPKALRLGLAHMPKLLHGDKAKEDAEAIASFLASLKPEGVKSENKEVAKDKVDAGKKLFDGLHCVACHNSPDGNETDAKKISLKQTAAKFVPGTLTAFLKQPDAHFAWIHMPRFKLGDDEREQIAAYVLSNADKPVESKGSSEKETIERGKKLVQSTGCLSCHGLKLENQFSTKALAEISDWKKGCLAEQPGDKAPNFTFSGEQREALQAFGATDRASLERHVPADFAMRYSAVLNCRQCHGQFEGFPNFEILGAKLKPEWMTKFIAGEINERPRPWLEGQMPAFPKYAEALAKGLATQNGLPPQTSAESPLDQEASKIGNRLVSNPPLGFSCISCHGVGSLKPTQVFEAPGVNLAMSGERLQPTFFKRWLRNPPMVDPQSKMPAYFDEQGKSQLTDVYEGDGEKQINAIWQYIRLGEKMPSPKTE